jgi:colanic acid/amylovoran biosynthesis protein
MNKTDRAILQEYRNADIIVSCGGGYLGGDKMWSTLFLFRIYLAKRMAKRVYLWGVSIEPFKEWILKEITRFVLRSVDIITVRETHSMKILKMLGISKCAFVTADAAFLTGCESLAYAAKTLSELGIPDTTILKIGMTLRRWHFPASDDPDERLLHYMNAISSALETMLREPGAIAILFPQSTVGPSDDDREISRKIRDMVREPMNRRIFILTDNYTPEQLKAMIGTVDVFIGTRMHSNIFAISMGVPTIAIAYELKSYGIMKMAGLERYVLDISSVTSEKIVHLVQEILQDRSSVTRRIKEELPGLKRESFRNGDFLGMLIGDCAKQGAHP